MEEQVKPIEQAEPEPKLEGVTPTVHYMDDLEYHTMANNFDLDFDTRRDQNIAEKLSFLSDWAKNQVKSEDRVQQMLAIKQLIRNLGYQMRGQELVKKLYQWTRLDMRRKNIESEMEAII